MPEFDLTHLLTYPKLILPYVLQSYVLLNHYRCGSMWARFKDELLYGHYDTTSMTVEQLKTLIWRYFIS